MLLGPQNPTGLRYPLFFSCESRIGPILASWPHRGEKTAAKNLYNSRLAMFGPTFFAQVSNGGSRRPIKPSLKRW